MRYSEVRLVGVIDDELDEVSEADYDKENDVGKADEWQWVWMRFVWLVMRICNADDDDEQDKVSKAGESMLQREWDW